MKYKVLGVVNLIIGFLQISISLLTLFVTIPSLRTLYAGYDVEAPNFALIYLMYFIIIVAGIINLFLSFKLFSNATNKEKYFIYGMISTIITLIFIGASYAFSLFSIILPIYNVTSIMK